MSPTISLNLDQSKILLSGNGLTLFQMMNFSLFQTEESANENSNLMKMAESSPKGKKTLWEKEKLLVTTNFSFFPTVFSKDWYCRHVKTRACFGKGQPIST